MILGMYVTRSKQHVWFIGDPLENILGAKLPSGRDVMRNLVHYHRVKNVNIQDAANRVYTQIKIPMWEKARIPTKAKLDVIIKIRLVQRTPIAEQASSTNHSGESAQSSRIHKKDVRLVRYCTCRR